MQKYSVTYTRLEEFMKSKYRINDIHLTEIDYKFITDFETYLLNVSLCNKNTTYKFMQRFKRITNIALRNGLLKSDPFVNYKIRTVKVDRGYLTQVELEAIMSKEFKIKRLEQVRDIFIFGCFTGLAYIDVSTLTKKHINRSFDDRLWITKKRQKTGIDSNILLLDIPKQILNKYKGYIGNGKGQLLPVSSNQKVNAYLKEIADLCGITKNLTFHLARHTFATTVTLAKGVPIETVSKMLGHTKISTTQIYARITDTKISDDMQRVADHFDNLGEIMNL